MNEQQVLELGARAQTLLNSKTFMLVVNHLHGLYNNTILMSEPHERAKREENYYLHKALSHIVDQLSGLVQAKDEIVAKSEQEREETNSG